MKKFILLILLFLGLLTNSQATTIPNSYMQLPVSWVQTVSGNELIAMSTGDGIHATLGQFLEFGLNKKGIITWEKLETNQYIRNFVTNDRMSGKKTVVKILFIKKDTPGSHIPPHTQRVLVSRIIVNGYEYNTGEIYNFMLTTCLSVGRILKAKTKQTSEHGLPSSVTKN